MESFTASPPALGRQPRRQSPLMVPRSLDGERGLLLVDATWGTINPITIAPGVRTVGELEVLEQLHLGRALIDCRRSHFFEAATIPGATGICHEVILEHMADLDPAEPAIFFCNGPQCAATPRAIRALLSARYPRSSILYYRGGLHDWLTLGLPTVPGRPQDQLGDC